MTLCVAWTRNVRDTNELIFASDSRLTGNGYLDYCPKVFSLPRNDTAIGFCGDTSIAYPYILQVINYITTYDKALSRAQDFSDMRHSLINVLNQLRSAHRDPLDDEFNRENLTTEFIVGGWSWKLQQFEIFKIIHAPDIERFTYRPSGTWRGQGDNEPRRGKKIAIAGDYVPEYRHRLTTLLRGREKLGRGGFDMEPFEVLRDMLRDDQFTDRTRANGGRIGGPPQMLKIYSHPNILPIAVRWGAPVGIHIMGRQLMEYERTTFPILNTDDLQFEYPLQNIAN